MNEQPKLSEAEWALMIELLQREHHDLPTEIHHCRVFSYRDELEDRHEMVRSLLERLQLKRNCHVPGIILGARHDQTKHRPSHCRRTAPHTSGNKADRSKDTRRDHQGLG